MARTTIDDAAGLAAADVIHKRFTALPDSATIGDVRKWFAASSHRRVAFLAEDGHYVGSLTPADLAGDLDAAGRRASEVARRGATIAPDAPASAAHELALSSDTRRVPVVDRHGRLVGVVGVTDDLAEGPQDPDGAALLRCCRRVGGMARPA